MVRCSENVSGVRGSYITSFIFIFLIPSLLVVLPQVESGLAEVIKKEQQEDKEGAPFIKVEVRKKLTPGKII